MRTKISLHVSDAKPVVSEDIFVRGNIRYYDKNRKMWIPFKAKLKMFVDEKFYEEKYTDPNGFFEFKFSSNEMGKKTIRIVYEGNKFEPSEKKIEVEFISAREKRRIERITKLILFLIIALIILSYIFIVLVKHYLK